MYGLLVYFSSIQSTQYIFRIECSKMYFKIANKNLFCLFALDVLRIKGLEILVLGTLGLGLVKKFSLDISRSFQQNYWKISLPSRQDKYTYFSKILFPKFLTHMPIIPLKWHVGLFQWAQWALSKYKVVVCSVSPQKQNIPHFSIWIFSGVTQHDKNLLIG